MGNLVFQATLGGQVNLVGPNTASTYNINVPAVAGNMVTTGDTGTVTNTMCATSVYTAPGTIGSGTPNTGAFTTLSASSTVSGTGFSDYLASPPAIGGTVPAAVTGSNLMSSGGMWAKSTYSGTTYSDGVVVDYTTGLGRISVGTSDGLAFYNAGVATTELMRLDSSGNLGIGTSSPDDKLKVFTSNGGGIRVGDGTVNVLLGTGAGPVGRLNVITNHGLIFQTNDTERMRIDSSGNVGIGGSAGSGVRLDVQTPNGTAAKVRWLLNGTDDWTWQIPTTGSFTLSNGTTERLRVDGNGSLLINQTTNPTGAKFAVTYPSTSNGSDFRSNSTTGYPAVFFTTSGQAGYIYTNGVVTTYNSVSDYRLKENVSRLTNCLSKILELNPVSYTFKNNNQYSQGFIAHELQAVVPECVTGEKDAIDADGNPIYQGIDTSFLVATLTAAIQEQQAIIQQLQADVAALKAPQ